MRLVSVLFLLGLLPLGAVLAMPASAHPAALVLDVERDALSLDGIWERLREHPAAEAWRPEVAAELGPGRRCPSRGRFTLADSICDRFVHNAHRLVLKGPSRRQEGKLDD